MATVRAGDSHNLGRGLHVASLDSIGELLYRPGKGHGTGWGELGVRIRDPH